MNFNKKENYLLNQLEKGDRNFKILFMSHNTYWAYLQELDMVYDNCSADVFGRGTAYIRHRENLNSADYDFIFYYSSTFYEDDELEEMKKIAFRIAENKNKRVSIGYSYVIPMEDRKDKDVFKEIKIVSFKDSIEYEETREGFQYFTHSDLIDMVLITHDKLEQKMNDNRN